MQRSPGVPALLVSARRTERHQIALYLFPSSLKLLFHSGPSSDRKDTTSSGPEASEKPQQVHVAQSNRENPLAVARVQLVPTSVPRAAPLPDSLTTTCTNQVCTRESDSVNHEFKQIKTGMLKSHTAAPAPATSGTAHHPLWSLISSRNKEMEEKELSISAGENYY